MKITLTAFVILFSILFSNAQVEVGFKTYKTASVQYEDYLSEFKNTKTIFVLSEVYDRSVYEKIIQDTWTVTPYEIVDRKEFRLRKYLKKEYSIARLDGFKHTRTSKSGSTSTYLYLYLSFKTYDVDNISKKLDKLSPKKRAKKYDAIVAENAKKFASFYLYPKDDFIKVALGNDMDKILYSLYKKDVIFNFKPGLLKNYFQFINKGLSDGTVTSLSASEKKPELSNLVNQKLFIPSYIGIKYSGLRAKDSEVDEKHLDKLFADYPYQYEVLDDDELSDKILNNEELYYLRYNRQNTERYLEVVNSKTGDIIYRNYFIGFAYNLKPKNIDDLVGKIKSAGDE